MNTDLFKKTVQSDVTITPDPCIEERLNYYFRLQHSRKKIYYNNFSGLFLWIFSGKALAVKTAVVVVLILFFMKSPVIKNNFVLTGDTCVSKNLVDTSFVTKDTCFN